MRFNKVLLLNFPYDKSIFKVPKILAGLGYLAEFLKYNNIEYDVLDMSTGYTEKDLFKKIKEYKTDLIGITLMTYQYLESYNKLNRIKNKFSNIKIVAGGPHISLFAGFLVSFPCRRKAICSVQEIGNPWIRA